MSQSPPSGTDSGPVELSERDRHLLLAVERRRVTLDVLTNRSAPLSLDDLANDVAEREVSDCVATAESVGRVAVSLHHQHLPKLADFGVVDYDPAEQLVRRTTVPESSDGENAMAMSTRAHRDWYLTELSDTDRHRLLAHDRRQAVLELLSGLTPPVELDDLATQLAVHESGGLVSSDEHAASVAIALHHAHLPKMDELGIIEYDPEEDRVELTTIAPATHGFQAD